MGKPSHRQTPSPVGRRPSHKSSGGKKDSGRRIPAWLTWSLAVSVLPVLFGMAGYQMYQTTVVLPGLVTTKSPLPTVLDADAFSPVKSPDLYWGTYRSNLYFGMRTRSPNGPVMGLMWFEQNSVNELQLPEIRHWCDQNDRLQYSWLKHDGRTFGVQEIIDRKISISTNFVKRPGGLHGGDWTARITAQSTDDQSPHMHSFIIYFALSGADSDGSTIQPILGYTDDDVPYLKAIQGYTPELGHFQMRFGPDKSPNTIARSFLATRLEPAVDMAHLKELMISGLGVVKTKNAHLQHYVALMGYVPPGAPKPDRPNVIAAQITFLRSTHVDVIFESRDNPTRVQSIEGDNFESVLQERIKAYDDKFESIFKLKEKSYPDIYKTLGNVALSNMLGSIGYFHGHSYVQSEYTYKPVPYGPLSLFTSIPSRPFFPRGFLWDEGFHHLLIRRFDGELSMEILASWMDLMNVEGWIPREMILGAEAEVRVPAEFIIQRNSVANPPMFFFVMSRFLNEPGFVQNHGAYLKKIYPRMLTWYKWLNSTQSGQEYGTYRWRGRNATTILELNPKTLPSGLDDYPRASHPSDDEYHVDLYCWMAVSSKVMAKLAEINQAPEFESLQSTAQALLVHLTIPYNQFHIHQVDSSLLDQLHWSEKQGRYCDYGLHTKAVQLDKPKPIVGQDGRPRMPPNAQWTRTVLRDPEHRLVSDTFGYVSLFPFFLRLIPADSPKLGRILDQLTDPDLLWSEFGLRSLAKSSPLYDTRNTEHDPPYWRGHVWMNMNYMALASLKYYADASSEHAETAFKVYTDLRQRVVANIVAQFHHTGFLWEHYNDQTGKGEGCHPFTGWSSLVLLMLAEEYD